MTSQHLTKDARALTDGVVTYLRRRGGNDSVVPKVQRLLIRVSEQAKKEKRAIVQTGVPLNASEKSSLEAILFRLLGHEVVVENTVHPDVVGGLRIQVADWVVDTTIKNQLNELIAKLVTH